MHTTEPIPPSRHAPTIATQYWLILFHHFTLLAHHLTTLGATTRSTLGSMLMKARDVCLPGSTQPPNWRRASRPREAPIYGCPRFWGFETDLGCFGPCPWSQNKSKINVNYGVLPGPTRHHPLNFEDLDCLLKDKHKVLSTKGSERCVCARERGRFDSGEEVEMRVEHNRTMME